MCELLHAICNWERVGIPRCSVITKFQAFRYAGQVDYFTNLQHERTYESRARG